MSILSGVVTGSAQQEGQRMVIAAPEGMGKTTLGAQAPGALLVPMEMGYGTIRVPRTPLLTSWEQVEALCLELIAGAKAGRIPRGSSIVWDTATALERLIHDHVVAADPASRSNPKLTMETSHGAYGKAYKVANDLFARWSRYQDELAKYGGINIVVLCHVFSSVVQDPAHGEYHTWDLLLHSPKNQTTYGKREFLTQWADFIGFLHEPLFVQKAEEGQKLQRAISSNQGRMLGVSRTPGWVAKNRYGLTGVIPIPKEDGWNYIADPIYKGSGIDLYNRNLIKGS